MKTGKIVEQKHLDEVLGLIKKKESELDHSIEHAQNEAQNINSHFFDDVKLETKNVNLGKLLKRLKN